MTLRKKLNGAAGGEVTKWILGALLGFLMLFLQQSMSANDTAIAQVNARVDRHAERLLLLERSAATCDAHYEEILRRLKIIEYEVSQ